MPVYFCSGKAQIASVYGSSHRALVLSAAALFAVVSAQAMTPNFFW
jgi:hypothetical protein